MSEIKASESWEDNPYLKERLTAKKGLDNYGKPRLEYYNKVVVMNEDELLKETKDKIWLSSYAANNPRSDYHWQCDVCYAICEKREGNIYGRAFDLVKKQLGY